MTNLAIMIPVVESEAGWGRKIDDWMVCISIKDAKAFEVEFNSKNTSETAPDWYMQVEGNPVPIELTDEQMRFLNEEKRIWLSQLKNIRELRKLSRIRKLKKLDESMR